MASAEPNPEHAERTRTRLYWLCLVFCVFVAYFLAADIVRSAGQYGAGAWVGVGLSVLTIGSLAACYLACAVGRLRLDQVVVRSLTVFHVSTLCVVTAVFADILIPHRDTGALALLLPWGISYWLHNLKPTEDRG